eukprot:1097694-Prymnesium_polylepis.1
MSASRAGSIRPSPASSPRRPATAPGAGSPAAEPDGAQPEPEEAEEEALPATAAEDEMAEVVRGNDEKLRELRKQKHSLELAVNVLFKE